MNFIQSNLNNLLAVAWFALCWGGYTRYAIWKGRDTACLASVLHLYREDWMRRMLLRDNRIADASVIGNLERNASFFASSTLIILAGILTVLGASDRALSLLADLPLVQQTSQGMSEIKLLCLAMVFVYAFFTFSWCMRQYNFAAVLVGSAPMIGERQATAWLSGNLHSPIFQFCPPPIPPKTTAKNLPSRGDRVFTCRKKGKPHRSCLYSILIRRMSKCNFPFTPLVLLGHPRGWQFWGGTGAVLGGSKMETYS